MTKTIKTFSGKSESEKTRVLKKLMEYTFENAKFEVRILHIAKRNTPPVTMSGSVLFDVVSQACETSRHMHGAMGEVLVQAFILCEGEPLPLDPEDAVSIVRIQSSPSHIPRKMLAPLSEEPEASTN
jgi:hypothetical protein